LQQNQRFVRVEGVGATTASTDFEALYRAHYPVLMCLGYLLTGSNEAAEDLVHDAPS